MMAAMWFMAGTITGQAAILRSFNYLFNRIYKNTIPDPPSIIIMRRRGLISEQTFYKWMAAGYGYDAQNADLIYRSTEAILTASEVVEAYRRGHITFVEAQNRLRMIGFRPEDANLIIQLGVRLFQAEELLALRRRGFIDENFYYENMEKLGIDRAKAEALYNLTERLLDAQALVIAYRRGYIDDEKYFEGMRKLGYNERDASLMFQVTLFYPGPSDWIRFAVRDVFNTVIVKKYGYDEEFPEGIVEHALKAGITEELMRYYWRAHWELPSPTMGYVMVQRLHPEVLRILGDKYVSLGIVSSKEEAISKLGTDLDTLRELLKIADYPKYWRDRMIAISYSPLTRVDLRRIYRLGLITREELIARLREIGYSPQDAELMANFYDVYKMEEGRNLTTSTIKKAYEDGLLERDEAKNMLMQIGYTEDEAELVLREVDVKLAEDIAKEVEATVMTQLIMGVIDENTAIGILSQYGIPQHRIERDIWKARYRKKRAIRNPTKDDIKRWVYYEVITIDEAREWLSRIGYPDDAVENFIREWTYTPPETGGEESGEEGTSS